MRYNPPMRILPIVPFLLALVFAASARAEDIKTMPPSLVGSLDEEFWWIDDSVKMGVLYVYDYRFLRVSRDLPKEKLTGILEIALARLQGKAFRTFGDGLDFFHGHFLYAGAARASKEGWGTDNWAEGKRPVAILWHTQEYVAQRGGVLLDERTRNWVQSLDDIHDLRNACDLRVPPFSDTTCGNSSFTLFPSDFQWDGRWTSYSDDGQEINFERYDCAAHSPSASDNTIRVAVNGESACLVLRRGSSFGANRPDPQAIRVEFPRSN